MKIITDYFHKKKDKICKFIEANTKINQKGLPVVGIDEPYRQLIKSGC